ncbi:MAG TPA: UDP-2,4-diacetamido-2,4,6-trideoxy-beta-L-altropyranose hydrolase [Aliidongia sp.]|nr:UDP-2,4-diacetamido-2,4,6-trideoxy-beta-L-altropyranose hydrolase [Aliidongia sp.]
MADFLFRADASPRMGIGHVMRCLAIAEGLADRGHRCHFACAELTEAAARRLDKEGITRHVLDGEAAFAVLVRALDPAALILDGYHLTPAFRREAASLGRPVLTFQDHADATPLHAGLIVNPPGNGADPAGRAAAPDALWICGREAILLRRELRTALALAMLPIEARPSILVSFGGTDPAGLTLPVAAALTRRLGPVKLEVVIGGGLVGAKALVGEIDALGSHISVHLDPFELGPLMRRSGLAVSAAGGTVGELAGLGVPSVIAVIAENQRLGAAAAAADGWCRAVDPDAAALAEAAATLWRDPAGRAEMAIRARGLVDGRGVERVVEALLGICTKV